MRAETDLTGKVAVITGGASGIGLALALRAAEEGMKVALGDVDEHLLAVALEEVNTRDVAAITVRADVSDVNAVRTLARSTEAELGPPWLVCNNSGVSGFGPGGRLTSANSKSAIDVNLWGVINGVQVFAPGMLERGGGHIVNIASADQFGIPGTAAYVAMTHAIVGLSEALYRELDSMGSQVGVTVVCPALMNTNVTSATRNQPGARKAEQAVPSATRDVPLLSPEGLAEEIFAAITARCFRVFPHTHLVRELSTNRSDAPGGSQGKVPAIWRAAPRIGRYDEWQYGRGTLSTVTHLRNSL